MRMALACVLALIATMMLTLGHAQDPRSRNRPPSNQDEDSRSVPNVGRQCVPTATFDPEDITKSETGWEVEWELSQPQNRPMAPPGSVLRIRNAKCMWKDRTGKPQWITVARMLEVAEVYVP